MDVTSRWVRARAIVIAVSALLGAIGALVPTMAARLGQVSVQERARLLQAQRDALGQLQEAARRAATADQVRRALQAAGRSLDTLGSATTILDPSLRNDLRRAASELTLLPPADAQRVALATRSALALLEKARAQLEGDAALGLPFQGSFSRSKPKEPAAGGHASAMGPAPPNVPDRKSVV